MAFIKIAGSICKIELDYLGGELATWNWKLDPYRVFDVAEDSVDFLVRLASEKELLEYTFDNLEGSHVFEQHLGFYMLYAVELQDSNLFWGFKRKSRDNNLLEYGVSADWKEIIIVRDNSDTAGSMAFEYLRFIIQGCLLLKDTLTFHGVLLEYNGKGLVLSADSGVGKTTRARLIRDTKRALILNGDRSVCKKIDGRWTGYGLPWCGSSGEYINREVPIQAIVLIERSENVKIQSVKGLEQFTQILHFVQAPFWNRKLSEKAMDLVEELIEDIPVVKFSGPPRKEAIDQLIEYLDM